MYQIRWAEGAPSPSREGSPGMAGHHYSVPPGQQGMYPCKMQSGPDRYVMSKQMTGGTPEVRSDKSLTLLTFDI